MSEELLTIDEVADYLRTSRHALYTQRHRGDAPGILGIKVGARILYRRATLDYWLDQQAESQAKEIAAR